MLHNFHVSACIMFNEELLDREKTYRVDILN